MLAIQVQSRGALLILNHERVKYLETVRKIMPILKDVPDDTIIFQFRQFLERLEQEVKNTEAECLDSKELIKMFLNKDRKLYEEIEKTYKDRVRNEEIRRIVKVGDITETVQETCLWWLVHVVRRDGEYVGWWRGRLRR